jgi:hypothetical protein
MPNLRIWDTLFTFIISSSFPRSGEGTKIVLISLNLGLSLKVIEKLPSASVNPY